MRMLLFAIVLLCIAAGFTACRKEYNCLCIGGFSGTDSLQTQVRATSEDRAEEDCESYGLPNGPDGYNCKLQ